MTESGGEGAVVKPSSFVATGSRGLLQPAVKCRGHEYLRVIYGPEYTLPEPLQRLRERGLSGKRSLALREFVHARPREHSADAALLERAPQVLEALASSEHVRWMRNQG